MMKQLSQYQELYWYISQSLIHTLVRRLPKPQTLASVKLSVQPRCSHHHRKTRPLPIPDEDNSTLSQGYASRRFREVGFLPEAAIRSSRRLETSVAVTAGRITARLD